MGSWDGWPPTVKATMLRDVGGEPDEFGAPTRSWEAVWEGEVAVDPGEGRAATETNRPDGAVATLTLHLPDGCDQDARGCRFALPAPYAGEWEVVGAPKPYPVSLNGYRYPVPVREVVG